MGSKVITYSDPRKLENLSAFHEYKDVLHICATKNLRDALVARHQKQKATITAPIIMGNHLLDQVFKGWDESITKLGQFLELSDIIRDLQDIEIDFKRAFRRNQTDILDTIRLLEISGITPSFVREYELSDKEELFVDIWDRFQDSSTVRHIRGLLKNGLSNWDKIVIDTVEAAYESTPEINYHEGYRYDTVVLHGFYFITPEQQQVFKLLQRAGIEIVFLQLYDERFPKSFDFISDFLNPTYGWAEKSSWIQEKWQGDSRSIADKFLYDFEGIQREYMSGIPKVSKYKDFYEFLDVFEKDVGNSDKTFLAPNAASLNDRLQDYYPGKFKHKRHFLSYPIGQYLYQLHQMWDEVENTLTISSDALFQCFASRWIYDDQTKKNAHEYTVVLEDLMIFFKGCHTRESWIRRTKELTHILEEVVEPFNKGNGDRFFMEMKSPFTSFSQFTHDKEDVNQVLRFIRIIFSTAYELFGDGQEKLSFMEHFESLLDILGDMNPYLEDKITRQEKELLMKVRELLQEAPHLPSLHVQDISSAISLFLAGKLDKDRGLEMEAIRAFIEIDGEVFKEKSITHITGLDENSLPYQEFELPWPLSHTLFDSLCKKIGPLRYMKLRNENVKEITRYLLYNALQFSHELELSWMVEYDGQDKLDKAVYLSQLHLEPEVEEQATNTDWNEETLVVEVTKEELDYFTSLPIDALAEFQFCGRRFYYSHIASDKSYFNSEFIQEFLFGNLLKSVGALLPSADNDTIRKEVFKIFPQWDDLKKETLADENLKYKHSTKTNYGGYMKYGENHEFTNMRKLFLFPVSSIKGETERVTSLYANPGEMLADARKELENQLTNNPLQLKAVPGVKCRYCPHNNICSEAYYSVDDRERERGGRS